MSDVPELTKWQVLFKNFEGAVWTSDKATLRTMKIVGTPIEHPDIEILKALAEEIRELKNKELRHYSEKQQSRVVSTDNPNKPQLDATKDVEIDRQLEQMFDQQPQTIVSSSDRIIQSPTVRIDPSQIALYEINENTRLETSIYPLSFRCYKCGHYEIINPMKSNLYCPCCKDGYCPSCGKSTEHKDGICNICHGKIKPNSLVQFSFVFGCPRCANLEELTPRVEKLRSVQGTTIPCQNTTGNCKGHMHFWMHGSFQASYWKCETCNFKLNVDKYCKCHIRPQPEQGIRGKPSIMRPIVTSAPSLTSPLIRSYLYMGDSNVSLDVLAKAHLDSRETDPKAWSLENQVGNIDLKILKEKYGVANAFTVPKITTLTIVYGYRSGISSHPITITDDERLAQLFKWGSKYHAYVVRTDGRGLIISLDKKKMMEILRKNNHTSFETYDEYVNHHLDGITRSEFQTIIDNPQLFPIVTILHSIEHALFRSLLDQIGLENFGSKIMIRDCSIVLYEREDFGIGGISQVTAGNQASEFKRLLSSSERQLRICPQLCDIGCIACTFINDFNCQPYLPNEVNRWLPPNSLLNRDLSKQFFNIV